MGAGERLPVESHTCEYAAQGGHLEVLRWAREQDPPCPWDRRTFDEARPRRPFSILRNRLLVETSVADRPQSRADTRLSFVKC